jgi:outer membrane lipoprotein-sorting protein
MKTTLSCAIAILALLASSGSAQSPAVENEQRLLTLVQQVQAQQAQIVTNQDKIDSKMAEVAEAIRVARIFAGRGGR